MLIARNSTHILFLFVLLLAFLLDQSFTHAQAVHIKGRVFSKNGPVDGATVYVYRTYQEIRDRTPFSTSDPTDIQGLYSLQLERGDYYFTAEKKDRGKRLFSYHGGNPIRVGTENIWIGLMASEETPPAYVKGVSSVQGTVTYKGKPVKNAHVALYTLKNKEFKGLGFLAGKSPSFIATASDNGSFSFPMTQGEYVVIARKTMEGNKIRPLNNGDLYCYAPSNPIQVKPDYSVQFEVPCYPKGNRLSFVDTPKIKKNDYLTLDNLKNNNEFGIRGQVTDIKGKPVQGVYVIAYRVVSSTLRHETEKITETDENGNYFVQLDNDGSYGLVVREHLGGEPEPEELTGLHHKNPWKGISFKTGQIIDNINITLE